MNIIWDLKKFEELTPDVIYKILQLRNEVFVIEQNCVFQDVDDNDQGAYHFTGTLDNKLVAYTRILPPGLMYQEVSIGRVVTRHALRRSGLGKELMLRSIKQVTDLYGQVSIKIGAQLYLKSFYSSLGFRQTSNIYLEDGIEHIEMLRDAGF